MERVFCIPNTTLGCGNGLCETSGTSCTCTIPFEYDLTWLRFPNCVLDFYTRDCIFITVLVIAIVCFFWSALWYRASHPKRITRRFCAWATVLCALDGLFLCFQLTQVDPAYSTFVLFAIYAIEIGITHPMLYWGSEKSTLVLEQRYSRKDSVYSVLFAHGFWVMIVMLFMWALLLVNESDWTQWNYIHTVWDTLVAVYISIEACFCLGAANRLRATLGRTAVQPIIQTAVASDVLSVDTVFAVLLFVVAFSYWDQGPWNQMYILSSILYMQPILHSLLLLRFSYKDKLHRTPPRAAEGSVVTSNLESCDEEVGRGAVGNEGAGDVVIPAV